MNKTMRSLIVKEKALTGSQRMPAKQMARSKSPVLLLLLALLALSLIFLLFSFHSPSPAGPSAILHPNQPTYKPETSFVASLEHFLLAHKSRPSKPRDDTVLTTPTQSQLKNLDDLVFQSDRHKLYADPYYRLSLPMRVYVYDMPSKFTYDLLWLFRNSYKETFNLTSNGSPVHRLIEQHSIDYWLWADLIAPESERLLKSVVRVHRQEEADLFYIPFFTTISFFLLEKQQCKALYREVVKWVTDQPAWNRSQGRDHILPVHHPWSFKSVRRLMKNAIWLLPDMDSTGNWYKPGQVYLEKDLILPYVANVDFCDARCISETRPKRTTLLFFRGRLKRNAQETRTLKEELGLSAFKTILNDKRTCVGYRGEVFSAVNGYLRQWTKESLWDKILSHSQLKNGGKIRSQLVAELSGSEGVAIEEGTAGEAGKAAAQNGMRKSVFCLSPAGDTPSSARLFDAIVSGCIPVIVSDELELPFEGILDYRKIALFISSSDAVRPGWLVTFLRNISHAQIEEMRENLAKYSRHFLYSSPAQPLGPEDLVWRVMAGKLVNIKLHTRRSQRAVKESRSICTCDCKHANSTTAGHL